MNSMVGTGSERSKSYGGEMEDDRDADAMAEKCVREEELEEKFLISSLQNTDEY